MRYTRGITLLNLLIGMVVSSIGVLAMLSLYKGMAEHSAISINDATQDGQQTLGILAAQMELQRAGFGINNPIAIDLDATTNKADLIILKKASLELKSANSSSYYAITTAQDKNIVVSKSQIDTAKTNGTPLNLTNFAIIWGYTQGPDFLASSYTCAGLIAQDYGLTLLRPKDDSPDCLHASDFSSVHWETTELITEKIALNSYTDDNNSNKTKLIFSYGTVSDCWPFGNTTAVSTLRFIIEVKSSFSISASGTQKNYKQYMQGFDICLPNFQSTSGT